MRRIVRCSDHSRWIWISQPSNKCSLAAHDRYWSLLVVVIVWSWTRIIWGWWVRVVGIWCNKVKIGASKWDVRVAGLSLSLTHSLVFLPLITLLLSLCSSLLHTTICYKSRDYALVCHLHPLFQQILTYFTVKSLFHWHLLFPSDLLVTTPSHHLTCAALAYILIILVIYQDIWSEGLLLLFGAGLLLWSPVVEAGAEEEANTLLHRDAEMDEKKNHNEEEDRVQPTLDATTVNLLQSSLAAGASWHWPLINRFML